MGGGEVCTRNSCKFFECHPVVQNIFQTDTCAVLDLELK